MQANGLPRTPCARPQPHLPELRRRWPYRRSLTAVLVGGMTAETDFSGLRLPGQPMKVQQWFSAWPDSPITIYRDASSDVVRAAPMPGRPTRQLGGIALT